MTRQAAEAVAYSVPSAPTSRASAVTVPALADLYGRLRAGVLQLSTHEGQWHFGLALLEESELLADRIAPV